MLALRLAEVNTLRAACQDFVKTWAGGSVSHLVMKAQHWCIVESNLDLGRALCFFSPQPLLSVPFRIVRGPPPTLAFSAKTCTNHILLVCCVSAARADRFSEPERPYSTTLVAEADQELTGS